MVVEMLVLRIIYLLRQAQARELETEQIKSRYLRSELELMKQQLNPHFFFNSLSTLSGIVRENPVKAQQFIGHLSRTFRNLLQEQQQLIPLKDELQHLHSFTELLKMRFEEGIVITVDVPAQYHQQLLPHLSLQLLIENAAKHNRAIAAQPFHLGGRADRGHEDLGAMAERAGGIGDGRPVVAAGSGDHAGRRHFRDQQLVEGAPSLERAADLQRLELERDRHRKAQRAGRQLERRRAPDMRPYPRPRRLDMLARNHGKQQASA